MQIRATLLTLFLFLLPISADAALVNRSAAGPKDGLVGHWTFDGKDITNGRINDISGQGNHGNPISIATSTFYATGKIGQGGNFDSTNDIIKTSSDFIGTGDISVSAWIKPNSFGENGGGRVVDNGKFLFGVVNSVCTNTLIVSSNDITNFACSASNSIAAGNWYFVTVTRTSGGTANLYVNGVLSGSADQNSGTPAGGTTNVMVGNRNAVDRTFDGTIDDVRIYSRALSSAEINRLYRIGQALKANTTRTDRVTDGLVGYWTFDGKHMRNGVAQDVSGQGNHGNLINIATTTFYKAGKIGQGGRFDGVNDHVVSMTNPISDYPFTLSAWIKAPTVNGQYYAVSYANTGSNTIYYALGSNGNVPSAKAYLATRSSIEDENAFAGSINLVPGKWTHLVAVLNSSTDRRLYVNGVADTTSAVSIPFVAGNNIAAGVTNRSSEFGFWPSSIDDVRFYNRALSVDEIKQLYNMGR